MNDIRLWQLLQVEKDETSKKELTALLQQMSQKPMKQRLPYLSMITQFLEGESLPSESDSLPSESESLPSEGESLPSKGDSLPYEGESLSLPTAAYHMLAGATGYPAWKLLLRGLQDSEGEVSRAAFQAFFASASYEPERWNHVLYHPDPALRAQALTQAPITYPKHQFLYLLGDSSLRQPIVELLQETILPPEQLSLLLDFVESRTISIAKAMHWLASLPWEQQADGYTDALGEGRPLIPWPETSEELSLLIEGFPFQAPDPLDRLNSWLWQAMDSPRESLRAQSLQIWSRIHRRWCRGYLSKNVLKRWALSLSSVGFCHWDWQPEPLALCARAMPCILAHPEIPVEIRRAAAYQLTPTNADAVTEKPLASLLSSDLCIRQDGHLDLRVVGSLLNLVTTHPYEALLREVTEDILLESLRADPSIAADFLVTPPQSRKEKHWHNNLLTRLLESLLVPDPDLIAQLTLRLPVDHLHFLKHIKQWKWDSIQEILHTLFDATIPNPHTKKDSSWRDSKEREHSLQAHRTTRDLGHSVNNHRRYSEPKIDRIAKALLDVLLPQQLLPFLQSLATSVHRSQAQSLDRSTESGLEVQSPKPETGEDGASPTTPNESGVEVQSPKPETGTPMSKEGPGASEVEASSEQSFAFERFSSLALACLDWIGRRVEVKELAQTIANLSVKEILAVLLLEQHCPTFPYEQEQELFHLLRQHEADEIKRAIPYTSVSKPTTPTFFQHRRGEPQQLTKTEAQHITFCDESMLEQSLEICFQKTVTGLCDALQDRAVHNPSVAACAALLACADEPEKIAATFSMFSQEESDFLSTLDSTVVRLYEGVEDLSLWGTAWLYRWDRQHNVFIQHLLAQPMGVMESLQWTLQLSSPVLVHQFWRATHRIVSRWRWHDKEQLQETFPDEIISFLVDLLLPPRHRTAFHKESLLSELGSPPSHWVSMLIPDTIQEEAASMLIVFLKTSMYSHALSLQREWMTPFLLQLRPNVQFILRDWLGSQGMTLRKKHRQASLEAVSTALLQEIRKNFVPRTLAEYCRDRRRMVVEEAASQLITLEEAGVRVLLDLVLEKPSLPHLRCLTETISLWEEESCLQTLRHVITHETEDPERRFLLAIAMCERGEAAWWETVLEALHQEVQEDWFLADDWVQLQRLRPSQRELSLTLIRSPLYGIYSRALLHLLDQEESWDHKRQQALIAFLQCGDRRPLSYRLRVAKQLHEHRCWEGLPLLCSEVLCQRRKQTQQESNWNRLWVHVPEALLLHNIQSALLAGDHHISWHHLMKCLAHPDVNPNARQHALLKIIRTTHHAYVQQEALHLLEHSTRRKTALRKLAETIAWGMKRGRELTGKIFRIEMIGGEQFGYTRLNESRIFVNPLPLLREEQHGKQILQGLILHEIGHHIYHADPESQNVWQQAHKEKMGQLLNLVSDEQLERSLRAKDPVYGNDLKRLAAYAFQHNDRDMTFSELLHLLGVQAFSVLHQTPLRPSRRPHSVILSLGKLFFALEASGYSFPRFVRALRMGLGNRHNDPKVGQALHLFRRNFRHSNMREMLQISYRLREIFGAECSLLDALSQDTIWSNINTEEVVAIGEGLTQDELQREVERILRGRPKQEQKRSGNPVRSINLTEEESFPLIHTIVPLVHNPTGHKSYRQQVKRWSSKMRDYLRRMGLGTLPQRRRLSGYRLDRPALSHALLRRDPRILMSRKTIQKADLFVGILVDCSGSMSMNNNLEKAKVFATMLAEATAPLRGIDTRFFGFTDTEIFDAGDAKRCAVHALEVGGGNNDAAALWHASQIARRSPRRARLLIMISDGSPTECSTTALRKLVQQLTDRMKICCAQVAVRPIEEVCFPHYIELTESNLDLAIHRFGSILAGLVKKAMVM